MMYKLWELQIRVDGKGYWQLLVVVLGDRYRLASQVGAVGWRLKLWIRVGQSYGSDLWVRDVDRGCQLELLLGAIGQSYWSELLVRVVDWSSWLPLLAGVVVVIVGQICRLELLIGVVVRVLLINHHHPSELFIAEVLISPCLLSCQVVLSELVVGILGLRG